MRTFRPLELLGPSEIRFDYNDIHLRFRPDAARTTQSMWFGTVCNMVALFIGRHEGDGGWYLDREFQFFVLVDGLEGDLGFGWVHTY